MRAQQKKFSRFPLPPLKATGDEAVLSCALCVLYLLNQVVNVIGLRCVDHDVPVPFCTSVNFANGKVYK
jgi:hypothetical protein